MGQTNIWIAIAFIVSLLFYYWLKQSDRKKLFLKFNKEDILMYTAGVRYLGLASEPGKLKETSGSMLLLKHGIYYKDRFGKRELFIPGENLLSIAVTDNQKGQATYYKCLAFYFKDQHTMIERAAFFIPHPDRWVEGIKKQFGNGRVIPIRKELW